MITSKQYDELTELLAKYRDAVSYVHTAAPEDRLDAAYDFAEADKAIEAYVLELVDFDKVQTAADDGWIEWEGRGECPVGNNAVIDIKFRDGSVRLKGDAHWLWWHAGNGYDIVAYRIVHN